MKKDLKEELQKAAKAILAAEDEYEKSWNNITSKYSKSLL